MRKINPSDICSDFQTEIDDLETFLASSMAVAASARNKSLLAELVFHRGYVAVEAFLSAWIIGAINRESQQYLSHRRNAVTQSLGAKFSTWDVSHLTYSPPAHVSVADLKALLDPDGWNITFKSYAQLRERCSDWLTPTYRNKVDGIPAQRTEIIDAAKAIRNCVAHQSQSSFDEMNSLLRALPNSGVAQHLRTSVNTVSNVGAHLKSIIGGKMRVEHYLHEFKNLGQDLA